MQLKRLGFLSLGVFGLFVISTPSFAQTFPYYVLDGYGGIHAGGGAAAISPATAYFGWDIAKAIDYVAVANTSTNYGDGLLVLDGYGGIHKGGKLSTVSLTATPYFGWNIARDIVARIIPPRASYSSYTSGNTELTSSTFVSIWSVTLYLPDDSYVLISACCSMGNNDPTNFAVARIAVGVDSTTTALDDLDSEEAFPAHYDSGSGWYLTWRTVARTQMAFVPAGSHTFYFLARKLGGTASLYYFSPNISVVAVDQGYYGDSAPDVQSAESRGVTGGKK